MAGPHPQPPPAAFSTMSPETLAEYIKLMAQQRREEAQLTQRINVAKSQQLQKHATETQQFWAKHSRSPIGGPYGSSNSPQPIARTSSAHSQSSRLVPATSCSLSNSAATATQTSPQQRLRNMAQQPVQMDKQTKYELMSKNFPSGRPAVQPKDTRVGEDIQSSQDTIRGTGPQPTATPTFQAKDLTRFAVDRRASPLGEQTAAPKFQRQNTLLSQKAIPSTLESKDAQPDLVHIPRPNNHFVPGDEATTNFRSIEDQIPVKPQSEWVHTQSSSESTKAALISNTGGTLVPSVPLFQSPIQRHPNPSPVADSLTTSPASTDMPLPGTPNGRKKPIPLDPRPELSPQALKEQRTNRSKILASPPKLPRNPGLLGLQQQQQTGGFVGDILRNARSEGWAPGLGQPFDLTTRSDAVIQDKSLVVGQQGAVPTQKERASIGPNDTATQNISSAVGSSQMGGSITPHASIENPILPSISRDHSTLGASKLSAFSSPNVQSDSKPGVENVPRHSVPESTLSSGASSRTYGGGSMHSPNKGSQHEPGGLTLGSAVLPAPVWTTSPTKRPRQVSVSSDDSDPTDSGSEFEPNPRKTPTARRKKAPAMAKSLIGTVSPEKSCGKPINHGSKLNGKRESPAGPTTPPSCSAGRQSLRSTPSVPKRRRTQADTPSASLSPQSASERTPRSAKLAAKDKIDEYVKNTKDPVTEEETRRANDKDVRHQIASHNESTPNKLRRELRGLNLTRASSPASSATSAYTISKWTRDRFNGDRYLAKIQSEGERDDSDGELAYASINARIVDGRIIMGSEKGTSKRSGKEMTPEYIDLTHL